MHSYQLSELHCTDLSRVNNKAAFAESRVESLEIKVWMLGKSEGGDNEGLVCLPIQQLSES